MGEREKGAVESPVSGKVHQEERKERRELENEASTPHLSLVLLSHSLVSLHLFSEVTLQLMLLCFLGDQRVRTQGGEPV